MRFSFLFHACFGCTNTAAIETSSSSSSSVFSSLSLYSSAPRSLAMLPFEILSLLLSFLPFRELARSPILVNRFFYAAVRHAWKHYPFEITISRKDLEFNFNIALFPFCKKLICSTPSPISGSFELVRPLVLSLLHLLQLQELNLRNCKVGDTSLCSFCTSVSSSSSYFEFLRDLNLSSTGITALGLHALIACFPSFPHLQKIDFSRNDFGDDAIRALTASLPSLSSLQSLDLSRTGMTSVGVSAIAAALPSLTHLIDLAVHDNPIDDAGFDTLWSVLQPPRTWICQLQSIYVSYNYVNLGICFERGREITLTQSDLPRLIF